MLEDTLILKGITKNDNMMEFDTTIYISKKLAKKIVNVTFYGRSFGNIYSIIDIGVLYNTNTRRNVRLYFKDIETGKNELDKLIKHLEYNNIF
jgi:hypothetical protein